MAKRTFVIFILSLLIFCTNAPVYAAHFKPIVTNFTTADYGDNAGNQNWCGTQGANGEMYFANNRGVLIYDGDRWRQEKIPSNALVRSVFYDKNRIYVGSYEEFGYFIYDEYGYLHYHSLSEGIKAINGSHNEIWNIVKVGNLIYFQAFFKYYVYDGEKVYEGKRDILPLYFHNIHNSLYTQITDDGYYRFDNNKLTTILTAEELQGDRIAAAIPLSGNEAILCGEKNGLYKMTGNKAVPFQTEIDGELRASGINRATITQDSLLIIGTILNGIFALDLNGKVKWHYNIESGIVNESVLGLYCDRDNNIWAMLDTGIALIHSGAPFRIMVPERGEKQIGMIYDIEYNANSLLLASNQGVFKYNIGSGKIQMLPQFSGQNWHITTVDDQTFIGNNARTYILDKNDNAEAIPGTTSSSTRLIRCNIHGQDILLESSYSELRIYKKRNGRWEMSNKVANFSAPIRHIEVDQSGTIWASNMIHGIYRIELDSNLKTAKSSTYFKQLDDSICSIDHIMKIRGRIVFSDNERLYTYDDITQKIIPYDLLNSALLSPKNIHSATRVTNDSFWLSGKDGYSLLKYEGNKFIVQQYIPLNLFTMQNNENNDMICVHGDVAYFNMNNAVAKYKMNDSSETDWKIPNLTFSKVSFTTQDGVITKLPISGDKSNPTVTNGNVEFILSFPNYNKELVLFKFHLTGETDIYTVKNTPEITYSDLDFGTYQLEVTACNSLEETVGKTVYYFTVPRPFYISTLAIILYIIILATAIFFISKWRTERALTKKRKEYEAERNIQNIKMLEQEKLIAEQQQQILKTELSTKSKELASMALDVYSKEKVIESLKDSMLTQKAKGGISQKDMDVLLKKIESNVSNLEFWNIYQKNFDLIHDHFFRNLRDRYPALTASDLKFCALLRLNLSTKDIAKFTNLTIRGVEAARYRLRKKFGLNEKDSLIEFLIDFK